MRHFYLRPPHEAEFNVAGRIGDDDVDSKAASGTTASQARGDQTRIEEALFVLVPSNKAVLNRVRERTEGIDGFDRGRQGSDVILRRDDFVLKRTPFAVRISSY